MTKSKIVAFHGTEGEQVVANLTTMFKIRDVEVIGFNCDAFDLYSVDYSRLFKSSLAGVDEAVMIVCMATDIKEWPVFVLGWFVASGVEEISTRVASLPRLIVFAEDGERICMSPRDVLGIVHKPLPFSALTQYAQIAPLKRTSLVPQKPVNEPAPDADGSTDRR